MSNLHQHIPEDCKKYIKGQSCDFRTCPFIHSAAQREDALTRQKQKRKSCEYIMSHKYNIQEDMNLIFNSD